MLFTWKIHKLPAARADLEVRSALLCTWGSLHKQNYFVHADVGFGRNEKAQQTCKKDCEKVFYLLLRTM